ncbi:MAG: hypothetical protein ACR2M4_02955 [Actinomycetota bacterium]
MPDKDFVKTSPKVTTPERVSPKIDKETGLTTDANDADDARSIEHPDAQKVRDGKLSATQLGDHAVGDTDVIEPPGYVETASVARARKTP